METPTPHTVTRAACLEFKTIYLSRRDQLTPETLQEIREHNAVLIALCKKKTAK